MAAITTLTKFSNVAENNSLSGQGVLAYTQPFASTSALVLRDAYIQHVCYAQLTGTMTINANVTALATEQFSRVVFHLSSDGTARAVTFGTGFVATATITPAINKDARIEFEFDGTALREVSRWIGA